MPGCHLPFLRPPPSARPGRMPWSSDSRGSTSGPPSTPHSGVAQKKGPRRHQAEMCANPFPAPHSPEPRAPPAFCRDQGALHPGRPAAPVAGPWLGGGPCGVQGACRACGGGRGCREGCTQACSLTPDPFPEEAQHAQGKALARGPRAMVRSRAACTAGVRQQPITRKPAPHGTGLGQKLDGRQC